jgi:hypothetical protein
MSWPRVVRSFSCDDCGRKVEDAIVLVQSNASRMVLVVVKAITPTR